MLCEWHKIDVVNAVIIPLLLALSVGVVIAIYTAYLSTRWFSFRQQIGAAMIEQNNFPLTLMKTPNMKEGKVAVHTMLIGPRLALNFDGQHQAAKRLQQIAREEERFFLQCIKDISSERGKPEAAFEDDAQWKSLAIDYLQRTKTRVMPLVEAIYYTKPNFMVLMGLPTLDNWLNRASSRRNGSGDPII